MPGVDEVVSCFEYKLELSAEFFVQMESVRMNLKKNEMGFPAESRTVRERSGRKRRRSLEKRKDRNRSDSRLEFERINFKKNLKKL